MKTTNTFRSIIFTAFVAGLIFSSCKKFVELGPPPTQTVLDEVFQTDPTATSAILAMYGGNAGSITQTVLNFSVLPGMSADDVQMSTSSAMYDEFRNNAIDPLTNNNNQNLLWGPAYQLIKNANNAIAGLSASQTLTPSVKDLLMGEAKFFRAYGYFHLVNFYGDVPMPLASNADYTVNATLPRSPAATVWNQVIADLKDAQTLLPAAYTGTNRARANKWAATTLLTRAYLYTNDFAKAEEEATKVIASGTYTLPAPGSAFINTSNEIILQTTNLTGVSILGPNYLAASGAPTYVLYDTIYNSFEANDQRKTNWTGSVTVGARTYYFVNKYKVRAGTGNEYNIILRFAELYLIRAEARARLDNLSGAKTDIDAVRSRAGLSDISATLTKPQMLQAIEQERKVELFGEFGHRWFDLKRTGRADAVIGGQKPATWQSTDVLYPIPGPQRIANTNLTQNEGYQ
jgi:hypothetical protein